MRFSLGKIALPFVLLVLCTVFFTAMALVTLGFFTDTSYKVITVFLSLILFSNIAAKICIHTIKKHETLL